MPIRTVERRSFPNSTTGAAPSGTSSYWQANHPVDHGTELAYDSLADGLTYTDVRACYAGIPPGTSFASTTSGDWTITAGGTYTDINHSGRIILGTNAPVNLVRVKARQTSSQYTLRIPSPYGENFTATDCEFSGGTSITILGSGRFVRCLGFDGNDGVRPRGEFFEWIESVYWWVKRSTEDAHSDALQFTNGGSNNINHFDCQRSIFSSYNPDLDDPGNAAIQTGGWGDDATSGVTGQVIDTFVDGGNYCVNAGGGSSWPMVTMSYSGLRFGLNMTFGPKQATGGNVTWSTGTNVWHASGTTRYGASVTGGASV